MRLAILLVAVLSITWVESTNVERPVRTPQGQIRYDVDGARVGDWKHLTSQEQWRSQVADNSQRIQRAEGGSGYQRQRQAQGTAPHQQQQKQQLQRLAAQPKPVQQAQQQVPGPQYYSYKPYTAVPSHIKQLIESAYQPQVPYVDPTSFLYSSSFVAPQQQPIYEQKQPTPAASEVPRSAYLQPSARYQADPRRAQSRHEYDGRVERQDRVVYEDEYAQQQQHQQQQQIHQIAEPIGTVPESPLPTLYLDRNMPAELKQLLQYQAQIPYDVTANRIQYTPKDLFIPKPLSDDAKGQYFYRSKVYYSNQAEDADYPQDHKPVEEQQQQH